MSKLENLSEQLFEDLEIQMTLFEKIETSYRKQLEKLEKD